MSDATRFPALRSLLTGTPLADTSDDEQEDIAPEDEEETGEDGEVEQDVEGNADDEAEEEQADTSAASYQSGVMAERKRWAKVLCSKEAEGKTDLAIDLLAEGMSAESACRVLKGRPSEQKKSRLASTPKHNLRGTPSGEGDDQDKDAAAASRKRAIENVNRGRGGDTKKKGE